MRALDAILLRRADEQVRSLTERLDDVPVVKDAGRRWLLPAVLEHLGGYRHGRTMAEVFHHLRDEGRSVTWAALTRAVYRAVRRGEVVRVEVAGELVGKEARYGVPR